PGVTDLTGEGRDTEPRWEDRALTLRNAAATLASGLHRQQLGPETVAVFRALLQALQAAPNYWDRVPVPARNRGEDALYSALRQAQNLDSDDPKYRNWKRSLDLEIDLAGHCLMLGTALIRCRTETPMDLEAIPVLIVLARGELGKRDATGQFRYAAGPS